MRVSSIVSSAALASAAFAAVVFPRDDDASDEQKANDLIESIKSDVFQRLDAREENLRKRGQEATCTAKNIVFRRE